MNNYDDIIDLKHFTSVKHKRMTIENRSAQFAPFAALTGYYDAIEEKARITKSKIILDENKKSDIDSKLQYINKNITSKIKITYFIKDNRKNGGRYSDYTGFIKKIDINNKIIIFDNEKILFDDIIDLEIL